MTKEERIAIARIVSDMIKADNIIEESEIRDMKRIMEEYSIRRQDMSDARNIRFSDAVTALRGLDVNERQRFFNRIYDIALSDNICVPREALLLIALKYCLVDIGQYSPKPYLISCATGENSLSDQYMVYLESSYHEERNQELEINFRVLVSDSRLRGFNFIYIPKMVAEFRNMDKQYVLDVIRYMAPNLSETFVNDVYDRLCEMTTSEFFRHVLYERLQVKVPFDIPPSLLINIGTSVVPYCAADGSVQYYTEFLCIPIAKSTLTLVDEILRFFDEKVSIHQNISVTDNRGQFKYFGFYKALFDFLIAPPPIEPNLVFAGQDTSTGRYQVIFKFGDCGEKVIRLTPQGYDLYKQIALKTYQSRQRGLPIGTKSRKMAPIISRIKNKISKELPELTYMEQYRPEKIGNIYHIRLDRSKVFIRTAEGHDVPIARYRPT